MFSECVYSELSPETFEGYSAETFEERIPVPIYFLPVVRVMQWFRSLTKHGNGGKQDWPAQNKKKLIEDF